MALKDQKIGNGKLTLMGSGTGGTNIDIKTKTSRYGSLTTNDFLLVAAGCSGYTQYNLVSSNSTSVGPPSCTYNAGTGILGITGTEARYQHNHSDTGALEQLIVFNTTVYVYLKENIEIVNS